MLDDLRLANFSPERNLLPALLTLFHARPSAEAGPSADALAVDAVGAA